MVNVANWKITMFLNGNSLYIYIQYIYIYFYGFWAIYTIAKCQITRKIPPFSSILQTKPPSFKNHDLIIQKHHYEPSITTKSPWHPPYIKIPIKSPLNHHWSLKKAMAVGRKNQALSLSVQDSYPAWRTPRPTEGPCPKVGRGGAWRSCGVALVNGQLIIVLGKL